MAISDDIPADEPRLGPRFGPPTSSNPWWRMVVGTGVIFFVSCLLWIVSGIGNPEVPAKQWLNRHGVVLVVVTGIFAIGSALAAMAIDQRQTNLMRSDDEKRQAGTHSGSGG